MITPSRDDALRVLQRIDALHTALSQIVLEGGDLTDIAAETARVVDVAVVDTSPAGRARAAALRDGAREALLAEGMFDDTGRFRVERLGAGPLRLGRGEIRAVRIAGAGSDLARLVCVSLDRKVSADDVHALERRLPEV